LSEEVREEHRRIKVIRRRKNNQPVYEVVELSDADVLILRLLKKIQQDLNDIKKSLGA